MRDEKTVEMSVRTEASWLIVLLAEMASGRGGVCNLVETLSPP
jgi:hypothetical protein